MIITHTKLLISVRNNIHSILECCNSIVLKGGNLVASHILKDKLGTYEFQSENANTESFYVLLRNSTFSSIVFGDGGKGWRVSFEYELMKQ